MSQSVPTTLAQFVLAPEGDLYRLQLKMEDGATVEMLVSFDQLDLLSEEIDRRLDQDEDGEEFAER